MVPEGIFQLLATKRQVNEPIFESFGSNVLQAGADRTIYWMYFEKKKAFGVTVDRKTIR